MDDMIVPGHEGHVFRELSYLGKGCIRRVLRLPGENLCSLTQVGFLASDSKNWGRKLKFDK